MATITKRIGKLGVSYRASIRISGQKPVAKSFRKAAAAKAWASKTEDQILSDQYREDEQHFGKIVDRYVSEIGRIMPFGKTKASVLSILRDNVGHLQLKDMTCTTLMDYAVRRSLTCCPSTIKMDMQYIGVVLSTAESMWGAKPKLDEYRKCMDTLHRLKVIASSDERERRCSDQELETVISGVQSVLPVGDWCHFAVCTAMRVAEIGRLRWRDLSEDGKSIIIRERKHPRRKKDEVVPLLPEARKIIARQPKDLANSELIFPHNAKSITTAFRKGRDRVGVEDLRFHDLRHEAISRLFELGFDSMVVATFSGHKDINMLRRYTHINANKVLTILENLAQKNHAA
jgi:hypothetical protein